MEVSRNRGEVSHLTIGRYLDLEADGLRHSRLLWNSRRLRAGVL